MVTKKQVINECVAAKETIDVYERSLESLWQEAHKMRSPLADKIEHIQFRATMVSLRNVVEYCCENALEAVDDRDAIIKANNNLEEYKNAYDTICAISKMCSKFNK